MPQTGRRIQSELGKLVGKTVEIVLTDGRVYRGILQDYDYPELNLLLTEVDIGVESRVPVLVLTGKIVAEIRAHETSVFNPREFAEYAVKKLGIRPDGVKVYDDAGIVMIYNTIKVDEHGVEGSGTLAAKVSHILKEYLEKKRRGEPLT